MSSEKYRYPGINFFTEADADIFWGRETDIERLYTEISLSDTMVLHAESGVGKSSLVRAGLTPYIAEMDETLVPVVVNFGRTKKYPNLKEIKVESDQKDFLLHILIDTIKEKLYSIDKDEKNAQRFFQRLKSKVIGLDKDKLPYMTSKEDSLWYLLKKIEQKGLKLLLIFDQFEEFQDYDTEQQLCLIKALAQLYESRIPPEINSEIDKNLDELFSSAMSPEEKEVYNANIKFLERDLRLKTLFVIREDKLGVMGLLSDHFPNILKNQFRLKSLHLEQAKDAIEIPAGLEGVYFKSPKFSFEADALNSLLESLKENKSEYIDPIHLQIVASDIEKKIKVKNKAITKNEIPNVKRVITSFYKKKWDIVRSKSAMGNKAFYQLREQILNGLIVNGNRNLVHEESFRQIENAIKIADLLKEEGIVKTEMKNGGNFYCLSHDRMLRPALNDLKKIQNDAENRRKTKKKIRKILVASTILLLGMLAVGLYFKQKKEIQFNNILYTLKKNEIQSKEFEFAKDSLKQVTIDSVTRINNSRIDSTIAIVEQSNVSKNEKNESIKSLEGLRLPTTVVRYFKRKADGDLITNTIATLDKSKYQLSIKESIAVDNNSSGVNTIYFGQNVPKERVKELMAQLNEKEEIITSSKPFQGIGGYDSKNNTIEILYETHDKKFHVRMYAHRPNTAVKLLLTDFLGEYYQLKVYPDWKKKPSFFSSVPTVLYYSDRTEYEALHLTNGLNQLLESKNVEFVHRRGYGLGISESDKKNTFIIHYIEE